MLHAMGKGLKKAYFITKSFYSAEPAKDYEISLINKLEHDLLKGKI
ncbi:hypothetical protein [Echinicola soli]|nr:hypothetical protein [Echinicola soli]